MRLNLEIPDNVVRLIEIERNAPGKIITEMVKDKVMAIVQEAITDEDRLASSYWNDMFDRDIANSNPEYD